MIKWNINVFNNPLVSSSSMESLRERRDLEPEDTSEDNEILSMEPRELLDELLCWEGIVGYTDTILEMIYEAYGINLEDYPFTDGEGYERECEDE